jgi:hypothetical protein
MECVVKTRLVEEHHLAAIAYLRAARALTQKRGRASVSEYRKLLEAADKALIASMEAQAAVKRHQAEHGC